jgi:hypothetical protein
MSDATVKSLFLEAVPERRPKHAAEFDKVKARPDRFVRAG